MNTNTAERPCAKGQEFSASPSACGPVLRRPRLGECVVGGDPPEHPRGRRPSLRSPDARPSTRPRRASFGTVREAGGCSRAQTGGPLAAPDLRAYVATGPTAGLRSAVRRQRRAGLVPGVRAALATHRRAGRRAGRRAARWGGFAPPLDEARKAAAKPRPPALCGLFRPSPLLGTRPSGGPPRRWRHRA